MAKQKGKVEVLERGNIFFFYRPKVEREEVHGSEEVQRFYMVLEPRGGKRRFRLLVVGGKRMPEIRDGGDRLWGFVDLVAGKPDEVRDELGRVEYETKTRGEREIPEARPAGEGVYEIVFHEDHTHLAYALELPRKPGEVQEELNLEQDASYIINVKNPEKPSPPGLGLSPERKADYPKKLMEKFAGRRFYMAEPEMLDREGTEILLIGAKHDPEEELDIRLDAEKENEHSAEIFRDLKLDREQHPVEPLFKGEWH